MSLSSRWRTRGTPLIAAAVFLFLFAACRTAPQTGSAEATSALRILVDTDGIYRLTTKELEQAGFSPEQFDLEHLQLTTDGSPVPVLIEEGALIFYGRATDSRYTRYRPYILEQGVAGRPFETLSASISAQDGSRVQQIPRELHLEENHNYVSDAVAEEGAEPWFWQTIQLQSIISVDFSLPAVSDGSGEIRFRLYGSTYNPNAEPDHSIGVSLNGSAPQALTWDGQTAYESTIALPQGTLHNGENSLLLENLPEEYLDIMRLDWVTIEYRSQPVAVNDQIRFSGVEGNITLSGFSDEPRILDISDPDAPRMLIGWDYADRVAQIAAREEMTVFAAGPDGYLSPAQITSLRRQPDWQVNEQQADLVIITSDQLAPALQPLVEARQKQGLTVALLPIQELYDTFGHGWQTPESITAFLAHALNRWQAPAPRYLLLVGEATTDYRGYLAARPENPTPLPDNIIPSTLVAVRFGGETISDARLADADGDGKPDLAVGRWPADTVAEVERLVERTLTYESGAAPDATLFAADGTSSEFINLTQRVVDKAQLPANTSKLLNGPTSAEFTQAWNQGAWLVTYAGHGSLELWGRDDVFSSSAIPTLDTGMNAPIVVQLTCLTGLFAHPETQSLSEALLLDDDGPVLVIGATSLTLSTHQEPFAVALLQGLQDPEVERIGDALWQAKRGLDVNNAGLREISDTFGLLGDPSTTIVRP